MKTNYSRIEINLSVLISEDNYITKYRRYLHIFIYIYDILVYNFYFYTEYNNNFPLK